MEISHAHPHAILWPESGPSPTTMDSNALYYGDHLDVLGRHVADESVDLVSRITSAMRFIWKRRPGMSRAVHASVLVGVSTDSMLLYVRRVLMGMTFAKHERIRGRCCSRRRRRRSRRHNCGSWNSLRSSCIHARLHLCMAVVGR